MPRFRLRTLLLAVLVLGCSLGCWFRPFTIERNWPGGGPMSQLQVRRTWDGQLVTAGTQSWWWNNGQLARQGTSQGVPLRWSEVEFHSRRFTSFSCVELPLENEQTYQFDGDPLPPTAWPQEAEAHCQSRRPAPRPTVYVGSSFPETPHDDDDRIYTVP